jgi:type IV pilus assembly protein PilM
MISQNVLSIDIGSKYIKIVKGKMKGNTVKVIKTVMVKTPSDSFNDGFILRMEDVGKRIKRTITKRRIKAGRVIFSTKSTGIISRNITIPIAKPTEMESMVKFEMEQYLPIDFENYVTKFKLLEQFEEDGATKAKVRAVVYPKEMITQYLLLAKVLKLKALALDINSNCITKIFGNNIIINNENYSFDETVAIIDLGYEQINFTILSKGIVEFSRIISIGGNNINVQLSEQLGIGWNEAEVFKCDECNLKEDIYGNELFEEVNRVIKMVVDEWIREIYKMVEYYKNSSHGLKKVEKLYIYGGSSNLTGIDEYLSKRLNLPVSLIENISSVKFMGSSKERDIEFYLNAIGAIIRL